jgi:hypothetical protein
MVVLRPMRPVLLPKVSPIVSLGDERICVLLLNASLQQELESFSALFLG